MSLAHSALCLGPVPACLALLVWPAAVRPLLSRWAAPEVSNTSVQRWEEVLMPAQLLALAHSRGWGICLWRKHYVSTSSPFSFEQCLTPLSQYTGYYCPVQTAVPLPCPEGTLNTVEGALARSACKLCPVGRYCRGDANWEPDGEFGS